MRWHKISKDVIKVDIDDYDVAIRRQIVPQNSSFILVISGIECGWYRELYRAQGEAEKWVDEQRYFDRIGQ
jgi:hypothetical protein